jgi:signal transduction histidine kinase
MRQTMLMPLRGLTFVGRDFSAELLSRQLLGDRLQLFAWVRYLVAASIVGGSLFAVHVVGVKGLDLAHLGGCAAVLVIYNTVVMALLRPTGTAPGPATYTWWAAISHVTITLDFLVLTYLIWLVGGAESPFLAFYLLHVILAAVLLSRRAAYAHALFGYLLLAGLVVSEGYGWIPRNRPEGAVPCGGVLEPRYVLALLSVYGLLMALAAFLMTGLAEALREGERKLRVANAELERLSNLRRAFLHIAVHDLKAPLGAISTLLTQLSSGLGGPLSAQQTQWVERAQTRLRELLNFLRDLQVLGELDTAQIAAQAAPLDLAALLRGLADEHEDLARQAGHVLRVEPPAGPCAVSGVERLVREALANYVTNAIKYTPRGGTVTVRAPRAGGFVRIEVQDSGKGIAAEDQAKLFQEFVRIRPKDQAGPPIPGTGLGLSIVRRIAELHGGRAGVVSQPGQGSTFYLELPAARGKPA